MKPIMSGPLRTTAGVATLALIAGALAVSLLAPRPVAALDDAAIDNNDDLYNLTAEYEAAREEAQKAKTLPSSGPKLAQPPPGAEEPQSCGLFDSLVCSILDAFNWVIDGIFRFVAAYTAGLFFSTMVETNRSFGQPGMDVNIVATAVNIGYPVVLGAANMFFVLILLWIAIATIFDFEQFTARQLLPKLVIAALLINFSLPIGRAFVNLSNGIADVFYRNLAGNKGDISQAISKMFPVETIIAIATQPLKGDTGQRDPQAVKAQMQKVSQPLPPHVAQATGLSNVSAYDCAYSQTVNTQKTASADLNIICQGLILSTFNSLNVTPSDGNFGPVMARVMAIGWKVLVFPIFIFVLFAAGVLLLIRLVALTFVLVLAPAAFLSLILPATRRYHTMWWTSLSQWAFFFPAFMFFFWLSFAMYQKIPAAVFLNQVAGQSAHVSIGTAIFAYFIATAFLVGSLIVAQKSGVYGSGAFVGAMAKVGNAGRTWAQNRGWKYAGKLTDRAMGTAAMQKAAKYLPPLRAGAATLMKRGAGVEKKDIDFYTKLGDRQLAGALQSMRGARAEEIWNSLSAKRKREARPELAELARDRKWTSAPETRPQTIAAAVTPLINNLPGLQNLPQNIRGAITDGMNQVLARLPAGAAPDAAAGAVQRAVLEATRGQSGTFQIEARVRSPEFQSELRTAIERAVGPGAGRAARTAGGIREDFDEEIKDIKSDIDELREQRPR